MIHWLLCTLLVLVTASITPAQILTVTPDPPRRGEGATLASHPTGDNLVGAGQVAAPVGLNSPSGFDVSGYPLGATPLSPAEGGGVVFRVWAPNAASVAVPGEFNGWNTGAAPMTPDAVTGIWSRHVASAEVGHEYKYVLDGTNWRIDPRARDTVNSTGNAIVATDGSDFPWQATDWETPDHDEMIIYELHVGTFSGNGDGVMNYPAGYRDVVDAHLDDLLTLGVNMVELMPIHEFPGGVSWGYNPVHFSAPESTHGSPDDLRYLIDTLHSHGIGVIIDVLYNHTSHWENNLWDFDGPENIYFFGNNCMGATPWGNTRPRYTEEQVRSLLIDNAVMWIEEYRADGLRLDATTQMRGYCNEMGEGWTLMGAITNAVHAANPRAIMIAEELPNNPLVTQPTTGGGAGFDAQWGDLFGDTLRAELSTIGVGGDPNMDAVATAITESGFGRPNEEVVKFTENHDEAGNAPRLTTLIDPSNPFSDRARGLSMTATGLALTGPGIPMLFMGQEFLEDKQFDDTEGNRIWWGFLDTWGGVRDFHGDLCRLRRTRGSLRASSGVQIIHINNGAEVIAFQRYDLSGDVTFILANFSATSFTSYLVGVPAAGT